LLGENKKKAPQGWHRLKSVRLGDGIKRNEELSGNDRSGGVWTCIQRKKPGCRGIIIQSDEKELLRRKKNKLGGRR